VELAAPKQYRRNPTCAQHNNSCNSKVSFGYTAGANSSDDVRMRFMRDALFHYLTDKSNCLEHLRAMCGVVDFTQVQRRKINKVFETKFFEKGVEKKAFDSANKS